MAFYTYMLASRRNGTLYIGHTDDLARRMYEHKAKIRSCFTKGYSVTILVWYEVFETRDAAFVCERQLKNWKRNWKLQLIEAKNPHWRDLYQTLNA